MQIGGREKQDAFCTGSATEAEWRQIANGAGLKKYEKDIRRGLGWILGNQPLKVLYATSIRQSERWYTHRERERTKDILNGR